MKISIVTIVLTCVGMLSVWTVFGRPLQDSSQRASQRPMDKWEALEWSLKNARPPYKSVDPKDGFVPDELTAVKIGEAVATAQYGEQRISQERPFEARLRGDVWTVMGTLHPQGVLGGTAVVQLSKKSGAIIFLTHQE
jgi:hypothetical protein